MKSTSRHSRARAPRRRRSRQPARGIARSRRATDRRPFPARHIVLSRRSRPDRTRLLDLGEDVARREHGPSVFGEPAQQRAYLHHSGGVEAVRGLVEDQELGILQQRARHAERGVDADVVLEATRSRQELEIAPAGEVPAERRLLDERADAVDPARARPERGPPQRGWPWSCRPRWPRGSRTRRPRGRPGPARRAR